MRFDFGLMVMDVVLMSSSSSSESTTVSWTVTYVSMPLFSSSLSRKAMKLVSRVLGDPSKLIEIKLCANLVGRMIAFETGVMV